MCTLATMLNFIALLFEVAGHLRQHIDSEPKVTSNNVAKNIMTCWETVHRN